MKISVLSDVFDLTKNVGNQIIDTPIIKTGKAGPFLLTLWKVEYNQGVVAGKSSNFIRATKSTSPTPISGSSTIPPIAISFICMGIIGENLGLNLFVNFERIDIIQISNITF